MSQASDTVDLGTVRFGNRLPLALIAGPCAMESRAHALEMAAALKEIAERLGIGLVYKSSFDKANRTSAGSARGIGLERGAADLRRGEGALRAAGDDRRARDRALRRRRRGRRHPADPGLPVPADRPPRRRRQDRPGGERQEGPVPRALGHGERGAKITDAGNPNVMVTERGASFGYNTLVSDMRALPIMAETTGAPVIFDATHSVQQPGGRGATSGGERRFVPVLARAAVAVGVAGRLHRDARGPGQGALRRAEHGAAAGDGEPLARVAGVRSAREAPRRGLRPSASLAASSPAMMWTIDRPGKRGLSPLASRARSAPSPSHRAAPPRAGPLSSCPPMRVDNRQMGDGRFMAGPRSGRLHRTKPRRRGPDRLHHAGGESGQSMTM